ncbi:iron-siderophore ABC transporter substrate-binding protein [Arthrobacter sp. NPDC090010]|uniref:iron-siderophore ABC transporter substrate-binding protein n=1 Tax=Arthrobacter sp. NPDC090010 TaxID=3363942 RepID=UPI0038285084
MLSDAPQPSRRTLLRTGAGLGAAVFSAVALAACSTGPAGGAAGATTTPSAGAFPVTIKHAFGETVIKQQPQRVATVAWVNDDVAIALGVVPVGLPKIEWGGNDKGSSPWKDAALEKLGAAFGTDKAPAMYSEADGINFTELAKTTPDIILAAYSGLSKEDYEKLSKIAPVVAYPELAWGTPWEEATTMIGKALGKESEAAELIKNVEQQIKDKAAAHPEIAGKTFIYGNLEPAKGDGVNVYTANDNRPRFLSAIGMTLAPVVADKSKGSKEFFLPWSAEKANELASDVFVTWVPDAKTTDAIKKDPLLSQIPAIKKGSFVAFEDKTVTLATSASSPLSLPWALDTTLEQIAAAAKKAGS